MLVWGKPGPKLPFSVKIELSQSFGNEYSSKWLGGAEEKSEIAAIPNKYKDTLDDLIDSSNTESQDRPNSSDWPGLIDKGLRNTSRSRNGSPTLLEEDRLDEDVPVTSLELAPKIRASQMHQRHDVAPFGPRSRRAQYRNGQRDGKDRKGKRGKENRKDERGGESHRGNKVDSVVEESSGSEASNYYHIIYRC